MDRLPLSRQFAMNDREKFMAPRTLHRIFYHPFQFLLHPQNLLRANRWWMEGEEPHEPVTNPDGVADRWLWFLRKGSLCLKCCPGLRVCSSGKARG